MEVSLEHYVEEDVHGDGGEGEAELLPAEGASAGEGGLINQESHLGGEGEVDLLPTDGAIDGEGGLITQEPHRGGEGEAELLPAEGAIVGEGGLLNQEPQGVVDLPAVVETKVNLNDLRSLCLPCFEMYVTWFPFFLGRFSKQVHQGVSYQSNNKIQRA